MSERTQALGRILAFVWSFTVAALISGVVSMFAILWGIVDILWQLLSGRNTLSERSAPSNLIKNVLTWNIDLMIYATTGGGPGRLEWLPPRWTS